MPSTPPVSRILRGRGVRPNRAAHARGARGRGRHPATVWRARPGHGHWKGFIPAFGQDLAKAAEARGAFVGSTLGTAVPHLHSNKVDMFCGLNPTPQRVLAVDVSHLLFKDLFTLVARPGVRPATWEDLNSPSARIARKVGPSNDQVISKICPKAEIQRRKSGPETTPAVRAGRADCQVLVALLALNVG